MASLLRRKHFIGWIHWGSIELRSNIFLNFTFASLHLCVKHKKGVMRILLTYAYIYIMKTRLNITIEETLLNKVKIYAAKHESSVSQLVEDYFKQLTKKPSKRKTILDIIAELPKPDIDENVDLKKEYYEQKGKEYGL